MKIAIFAARNQIIKINHYARIYENYDSHVVDVGNVCYCRMQ